MNGNDVELMCEIYDLANPDWQGTTSEFRELISANPRWSAKRLLMEAQCLIPALVKHHVLVQYDRVDGRDVVRVRNIDVCFATREPETDYELFDRNGLSLNYRISKSGKVYTV